MYSLSCTINLNCSSGLIRPSPMSCTGQIKIGQSEKLCLGSIHFLFIIGGGGGGWMMVGRDLEGGSVKISRPILMGGGGDKAYFALFNIF